jgi:hypothetical protein
MRCNPRRLTCRRESEENAGSEGNSQTEQKHAPVELYLHRFQLGRIRQQPQDNVAAEIAEEQTRRSPKAGKQQALGEHLPDETSAAGPQSNARAQFTLPGRRARQEQIREIEASKQQY